MLEHLAETPLGEQSRAHHRNLLLAGSLAIVIAQLNLVPTRISALGVDLHSGDRHGIRIALLIAMIYFVVAFTTSALADAVAWRERHSEASAAQHDNLETLAELQEERNAASQQLLGDPARVTTASETYERLDRRFLAATRRRTLYALLVPVDLLRGVVDFAIPLGVGIAAIICLADGLV